MKKIFSAITVLILALVFGGVKTEASEFSFSVDTVVPTNQIDKNQTYFDLLMSPDQSQDLTIKLHNDTNRDVKVGITANSATTNVNGVVEYGKNGIKPDKTLKYNVKDLVQYPSEVNLAKQSEQDITVSVKMPNQAYQGLIAGGLTFKEIKSDSQKKADKNNKGMSINNEYSYVVALLLRQTTDNGQPNLKLNKVKAGQLNYRNAILANLQNPQAVYLNNLAVKAQVTKKGATKKLYQTSKVNMQMAPNSNFNFPISLKGKSLAAGTYHYHAVAYGQKDSEGKYVYGKTQSGDPQHYRYRWILDRDFTIKADEAREFNKKDVTIKADYTWLYILIGILLLLIVLLIIFFIKRRKKDQEQDEEEI